jgi:hypothetical protein
MSIDLWNERILSTQEKSKRFTFFNPSTNGLGSWIDFFEISESDVVGRKVQLLKFRFEFGEGFLNIADSDGKIREPFYDRSWFFGELTRHGKTCMTRFRFVDEPSSGTELGTRIFTHWRHGQWKELPKQDQHGILSNSDSEISFGWSVNGNAFYWEVKPVEPTETPKEAAKAPKSFVPKAAPVEAKTEEPTAEAAPVKKPKIFVPKSKQTDLPQS